jgi:hypothetical protein
LTGRYADRRDEVHAGRRIALCDEGLQPG